MTVEQAETLGKALLDAAARARTAGQGENDVIDLIGALNAEFDAALSEYLKTRNAN